MEVTGASQGHEGRQPSPRCSFVCATNLLLLGSLEIKRRARRRRGERQKSDSGICVYSALAHILVSSPARRRGGIQKSLDERASLSRSRISARFIYISLRALCPNRLRGGLSTLGFTSLEHFRGALSRAAHLSHMCAAITHIYTKHLAASLNTC